MCSQADLESVSKKKAICVFLLVLTTILWGSTFIITRTIIQEVPLLLYITIRYLIGLLGFIPFFPRIRHINKKILVMGGFTGVIYYLSVVFQTIGLLTTTAGKAGFITGLGTIMVPFMTWLLFKKPVRLRTWVAVALSIVGMALLLLDNESSILIGDLLMLVCAFFCAVFIVYNDKYVHLVDIYLYSIVQLATITLLCFVSMLIFGISYYSALGNPTFWIILLYMGLFTTTATVIFQNFSQKFLNASQTAIIFTLEPVFAAIFGYLIGNELLSPQALIGCSIIFLAILITVLENKKIHFHHRLK